MASEDASMVRWLVFGDDWARHPSTTQHLVSHLPPSDEVTWIDSLGMRAPRLTAADFRRVAGRLSQALRRPDVADPNAQAHPARIVRPLLLPWHDRALVVALNRRILAAILGRRPERVALVANPVAALYLEALGVRKILYLRLDRYEDVPGVDRALVTRVEPRLVRMADTILAPNDLILDGMPPAKSFVLPQGVDLDRFVEVPLEPPPTKVCGYWGWIGEWLDLPLVRAVAAAHPDWIFELRGPRRIALSDGDLGPNVRVLPPVPHTELARHAAHWRAAWAPLTMTHHMAHASPLKLREYLAAGLPTCATPIPEARTLASIAIVSDAAEVSAFLATALQDEPARRLARRQSVALESWAERAFALRSYATAGAVGVPRAEPRSF